MADRAHADCSSLHLRHHAGFLVAWTAFSDQHSRIVILGEPRPDAPLCQLFNADLAAGADGCDVHDFNRSAAWQRQFTQGNA